jgi:hypothetical protein
MPEMSSSDKLAVVLALLGAALALILFLLEKTPLIVGAVLVAIALLLVYPIIHFAKRTVLRVMALVVMVILVGLLGRVVWPIKLTPPPVASTENPAIAPNNAEKPQPSDQGKQAPAPDSKPTTTVHPKPKQDVSNSGKSGQAIGSITQGAGSALSFNQQGGVTAATINNFGAPVLATPTVKVCTSYQDPVSDGDDFKAVVTFSTSSQFPRPFFALFFDGPVLEGNAGRVRGSYGFTHGRADKMPNPENTFVFRTTGFELGGTANWFPSDGAIQATVPSKTRVKLVKVLTGGGDDPDAVFNANLDYNCP